MSLNRTPTMVWNDHSGTIAAAGVAQQLMAANPMRIGCLIQNLHATETMYVKFQSITGTDATSNAPGEIAIAPLNILLLAEYADPGIVSIIAATLAHPFTAKDWGV